MLQLLLGSGGSGKTTALYEAVRAQMAQTDGCMLVVPEQASFEAERRILKLLGAKNAQRVEVVSFRRLADHVYRNYGRPQGAVLSDGGRCILMSLALEQVADELTFYKGYADTDELVDMLLSFEKELKQCGVSPEELFRLRPLAEEETLRTKLREIGLILSAYEALTAQSYLDPLDDLTRIRPVIEAERLFEGRSIFVDGFKDFTVQETELLRLMLRQASQVTVALCTDRLHDTEGGRGLFSPVCKTAAALTRLARADGVPVASPKILAPGARYGAPELAFLEQNLFRAQRGQWNGPVEAVRCFRGKNRHDEASFVAQEICRLVAEEGYRYRDFAVIARDLQAYRSVLDAALDRHGICYFLDDPSPVEGEPVMQAVLAAFRILIEGYDTEAVFAYLKTGMVQCFSHQDISNLENYTYLWGITGKRWREEWTANPSGFSGAFTETERAQLAELNHLREALVAPLQHLAFAVKGKTGREISGAVYDFLLEIGADQQVLRLSQRLQELGRFPQAQEQLRLWELLMEALDQMALILHSTPVTKERYDALFRLVLSSAEMAGIPHGVDQVAVGEAGRMRPADPKVVFLLGVVQDEFPAAVSESGAFCDRERRELIELGLPLVTTLDSAEADETFLAYSSAVCASERLYLTWFETDLSGEGKSRSPLLREVRGVLPGMVELTRSVLPKEREICSPETAFGVLAREARGGSLLAATLEALFQEEPDYAGRCQALARTVAGGPRQFADPAKARQLFPGSLRLSASQVESYHLCQFQYFCKYGLRAKERKPAELTALEYGSLIHYLLESLFRSYGHQRLYAMEEPELKAVISTAIERYLEEEMGGAEDKTPRFLFLFQRLSESAAVVIRHVAQELCQSEFQPVGYEMTLEQGGDFPPLTLPLADGGEATVIGVIDRVDLYVANGEQYVRVVDYKTGTKEFRLCDVLNGINLQMLIYLASLLETGRLAPAGVLYVPAARPIVSLEKGAPPEAVAKAVEKKLRMNGLLVDDPKLLTAMERDGAGKYIPVTVKDGVAGKSASTVTRRQIEGVLRYIKGLIGEMGLQLHLGKVADEPLKGAYDGCAYCPYFSICCHEEAEGGRLAQRLDNRKTLELLLTQQGEEGDYGGKLDAGTTKRH